MQQKMQKFKQLHSKLSSLPIPQTPYEPTDLQYRHQQPYQLQKEKQPNSRVLHQSSSQSRMQYQPLGQPFWQGSSLHSPQNINQNQNAHPIPNKTKLKTLQNLVTRLMHSEEQDTISQEYRINSYLQQIRKMETAGKESAEKMEERQHNTRLQLTKLQKLIRKGSEKMSKQRKQVDKKLQSALEGYLIDLTGLKSKAQSGCQTSIRQLQSLQTEVQQISREIQTETLTSKEIMKKVYSQFTVQIQELNDQISHEKNQRQQEIEVVLASLEKAYNRLSLELIDCKKVRERNDKEIVDLLERVIEKVRMELTRQ